MTSINGYTVPTIETDVLVVGAGPAGASLGAFLGHYGVKGLIISRGNGTVKTPRAHYTNMAAIECLRDIGLEKEVKRRGNVYNEQGFNNFRWTNAQGGVEYFRAIGFGTDPHRQGEYFEASPCDYIDFPQTQSEPLLIRHATHHGFHVRFDTELISFSDDRSTGIVTTVIEDQLTGQRIHVKSKFLCGADGGRSKVAEQLGLPFTHGPGGAWAINVFYEAELTHLVEPARQGLLHGTYREDIDRPDWAAMGMNRMVSPWNEWLFILLAAPHVEKIEASDSEIVDWTKKMIGVDVPDFKLKRISYWKINEDYAEPDLGKGNVVCLGDAVHRHPPTNGLGSNTCIQDAYNLAWKLSYILKHSPSPQSLQRDHLLRSYTAERAPVAKQIVTRANDSARMMANLDSSIGMFNPNTSQRNATIKEFRSGTSQKGKEMRKKIKETMEGLGVLVGCTGAEMNQFYDGSKGAAIYDDDEKQEGRKPPEYKGNFDENYTESTYPGFRLPHAWLFDNARRAGDMISTQDIAGKGRFTLFTGLGGKKAWVKAVEVAKKDVQGLEIECFSIGPTQDYEDAYFMWENKREVEEDGAVLVRPDRFVCWRCFSLEGKGQGELELMLKRALRAVLGL